MSALAEQIKKHQEIFLADENLVLFALWKTGGSSIRVRITNSDQI
jgi:hypothetical protein